jgi:hypothetical protein
MKYLAFLVLLLGLPLLALAQSTDIGSGFIPLTNIPILEQTGNSFSLDQFLNGLYKICIGIAAVLAVLQIMRAGIMYMGGDSVTEKKEAKNLIAMAIGGLILVLSPVVVFSVINPEILSLKIDPSGLKGTDPNFTTPLDRALWTADSSVRSREQAKALCDSQGGRIVYTCTVSGSGTARTVPAGQACATGETNVNVCLAPTGAVTTTESCNAQYANITAIPRAANGANQVCNAAENYSTIPRGCCAGISALRTACVAESLRPSATRTQCSLSMDSRDGT